MDKPKQTQKRINFKPSARLKTAGKEKTMCEEKNHDYANFDCPSCGHSCCWNCSVRCTDDSTGDGVFTCPRCGQSGRYENSQLELKKAASAMGRKGGKSRSDAKIKAVSENARKPRPGRKAKPFTHALVVAYAAPHLGERGDIISRHTSYELARAAAKRSGYDDFLRIDEINTP